MKVCFETFGCRLNRAEALAMEAEYLARGWTLTKKHSEANLFVVRGCAVTRKAEHDTDKLIDHLKRHYPTTRLVIAGCTKRRTAFKTPLELKDSPIADPLPTRTARAYLKVQDGCNCKCAFCIVPQFRGDSRSTPFEEALDKAKRFVEAGYHEIVVTGCNLAQYNSQSRRLDELVAALAAIDPACRIRVGSIEPGDVAAKLVELMAETPNICRMLHLPIQSGSARILSAMRRPYTIKSVIDLVNKAFKRIPLLGLGCDLMTGFPGESDADYGATLGLLNRLPFSNAHVFPFSARPGTYAAGLPGAIPHEIKAARARELSKVAAEKRRIFAKKFLGREVEVVIENKKTCTGWTGEYFSCEIVNHQRDRSLERKDLVKVHIMDARDDKLKGVIV